jgi:hypothetical protein
MNKRASLLLSLYLFSLGYYMLRAAVDRAEQNTAFLGLDWASQDRHLISSFQIWPTAASCLKMYLMNGLGVVPPPSKFTQLLIFFITYQYIYNKYILGEITRPQKHFGRCLSVNVGLIFKHPWGLS